MCVCVTKLNILCVVAYMWMLSPPVVFAPVDIHVLMVSKPYVQRESKFICDVNVFFYRIYIYMIISMYI